MCWRVFVYQRRIDGGSHGRQLLVPLRIFLTPMGLPGEEFAGMMLFLTRLCDMRGAKKSPGASADV